jgi:hypothetical protein
MVVAIKWRRVFSWLLAKERLIGTKQPRNVGLGSTTESTIATALDISAKMILHWTDTLELVSTFIDQSINEALRVLHGNCKVININTDILVVCATVLRPNIRISLAWRESVIAKCIGKMCIPPGTGCAKTIYRAFWIRRI